MQNRFVNTLNVAVVGSGPAGLYTAEALIKQGAGAPRRLTPLECARLMGFPDDKRIVVSDTQAYRQFGNAVVPKVAKAVGEQIIATLRWQLMRDGCLLKTSGNGNSKSRPG